MGPLKHKGTRLGLVVVGCLQVRAPAPPARSAAACVSRPRALRLAAAASGGPWGDTSVTPSFLKFGGMHLDWASPAAMPWQADGAFDSDGGVSSFSVTLGRPTATLRVFSHAAILLH